MLKNLEKKFNHYCKSKNLEINKNQFLVIKKLQDYYNTNFKQRVGQMSYSLAHTRSKQCVNIYYNFTSLDIIKIA